MTTTTKRTKIEAARPPKEIRDNTKERRAWLSAKVAELTAAGFEAKIVGSGSYQEVSVYRVDSVAARMQSRGVCQGCGNDVAIVDGVTAHHGYQRPGYGYQTRSCIGARRVPANVSVEFTRKVIGDMREAAAIIEPTLPTLEAKYRELVPIGASLPYLSVADKRAGKSTPAHDALNAWQAARHAVEGNRAYAVQLETYALPAFGTPLREVPVV